MATRRLFGPSAYALEPLENRQFLSGDTPLAPPVLSGQAPIDGSVWLSWSGSGSGLAPGMINWPVWIPAKSHVEQQNPDGSFTQIGYVDQMAGMYSSLEDFNVDGLAVGGTYTFRVGIEDGSTLLYSNPVTVTVQYYAPPTLTGVALSAHAVDLNWSDPDAPPGTTYDVYRSLLGASSTSYSDLIAQNVAGTHYFDGPSADFTDQGLTPDTTYTYLVTAVLPETITGGFYPTQTQPSPAVSATTAPQAVTVSPMPIFTVPGVPFSGEVAEFYDGTDGRQASEFRAEITWADGSTSQGTITHMTRTDISSFSVWADHTFSTADGANKYVIRITDSTGAEVQPVGASPTFGSTRSLTLVPTTPYDNQGTPFIETVAQFTDGASPGTADDYAATIDWGDGVTSPGLVVAQYGHFAIVGNHEYLLGPYEQSAHVTVTRVSQPATTASGTVQFQLGSNGSGSAIGFTVVAGQTYSGKIAGFSDQYLTASNNGYTATVTWADGTTAPARIVADPTNDYTLYGSTFHAYAVYADLTPATTQDFTVQISDAGGLVATLRGGHANVGSVSELSQFDVSPTYYETNLVYGGEVTAFTDGLSPGAVADYTATIDWGDGSPPTAGTVTQTPDGVFQVIGYHVYRGFDDYNAVVTITRRPTFAFVTPPPAQPADSAAAVLGLDSPPPAPSAPAATPPTLESAPVQLTLNPDPPAPSEPAADFVPQDLPPGIRWAGSNFDPQNDWDDGDEIAAPFNTPERQASGHRLAAAPALDDIVLTRLNRSAVFFATAPVPPAAPAGPQGRGAAAPPVSVVSMSLLLAAGLVEIPQRRKAIRNAK